MSKVARASVGLATIEVPATDRTTVMVRVCERSLDPEPGPVALIMLGPFFPHLILDLTPQQARKVRGWLRGPQTRGNHP